MIGHNSLPDFATRKVWESLGLTIPESAISISKNRGGQDVFHRIQTSNFNHNLPQTHGCTL